MAIVYEVVFTQYNNADLFESFDLSPLDLTGATFSMKVKACDGTEKVALTSGDGITVTLADHQIDIHIEASEFADWELGEYLHDLLITQDGVTRTVFTGRLVLLQGVT